MWYFSKRSEDTQIVFFLISILFYHFHFYYLGNCIYFCLDFKISKILKRFSTIKKIPFWLLSLIITTCLTAWSNFDYIEPSSLPCQSFTMNLYWMDQRWHPNRPVSYIPWTQPDGTELVSKLEHAKCTAC